MEADARDGSGNSVRTPGPPGSGISAAGGSRKMAREANGVLGANVVVAPGNSIGAKGETSALFKGGLRPTDGA